MRASVFREDRKGIRESRVCVLGVKTGYALKVICYRQDFWMTVP